MALALLLRNFPLVFLLSHGCERKALQFNGEASKVCLEFALLARTRLADNATTVAKFIGSAALINDLKIASQVSRGG